MKQCEKIDKLYYATFGYNGDNNGMLKKQDKMSDQITALFKKWDEFILNRGATCPHVQEGQSKSVKIDRAITRIAGLVALATFITKMIGLW
jgi:hypothetical protein